MKNLKRLERDGLLKSKSYGLGREMLWSLTKTKLIKELGYIPPKGEIHAILYEHEKACADVFVSLALTDTLLEWQGEGNQKTGFRHDRMFRIDDPVTYLEMEMGNHAPVRLREKIARYIDHYRNNYQPFNVLFSVPTEADIDNLVLLFDEFRLGRQYMAVLHTELVKDPLNARVTTRTSTEIMSNQLSNHATNE